MLNRKDEDKEPHKTALTLLENIQRTTDEELEDKSAKMVKLVIDEKAGTMEVSGVNGPVKVFNKSRKLILIRTAKNNKAQFKIGKLKKGRYILEAEHQFFEFVR